MRKECEINSDRDNVKLLKLYCLDRIFLVFVDDFCLLCC